MRTINAAEFKEHATEYAELARSEPVTVTMQGKPSVVLVSADEYVKLKQIEAHATKSAWLHELPEETINQIIHGEVDHLPKD